MIKLEVSGEWGGAVGDWRPAITGTHNQTGRSDEEASSFETHDDAMAAYENLVLPEHLYEPEKASFRLVLEDGETEDLDEEDEPDDEPDVPGFAFGLAIKSRDASYAVGKSLNHAWTTEHDAALAEELERPPTPKELATAKGAFRDAMYAFEVAPPGGPRDTRGK
jgi:hypothetical protein